LSPPRLILLLLALLAAAPLARGAPPIDADYFERQIRPVLATVCQNCHGPRKQEGGLRLDTREAALKGGVFGPAIVPEKPDQSWLIRALRYDHADLKMPPQGKLADGQVAAFQAWIAGGAPWPQTDPAHDQTAAKDVPAATDLWSLKPLRPVAPPAVATADWPRAPVDHFLLAALETRGLLPNPDADASTLLRRVYFDLTGC
jgi:hypothetical protein